MTGSQGVTKVQCEACATLFVVSVGSKPTGDGGERWHFACPYCRHEVEVATITQRGVGLRRQIEELKARLRLSPTDLALIARRDRLAEIMAGEVSGKNG